MHIREPKRVAHTALALLASLPFCAIAGEDVNERRVLGERGLVEIYNTRGEVAVEGSEEPEVSVRGELDDLAESLEFRVSDGVAVIRVKMRERNVRWGDGSDLRIRVPHASRVYFRGVSTELKIRSITSDVDIDTVSGDVRAREIRQGQRVKTVSGDVTLRDSAGDLRVTSVSGDVELHVDAQSAVIDAVSGEVEGELGHVDELSLKLISGEAELSAALNEAAEVYVESASGDVDLRLAVPIDAEVDLRTGPGGDIDHGLDDTRPEKNTMSGRSLRTRLGAGTARVRMQTISGDLRVHAS